MTVKTRYLLPAPTLHIVAIIYARNQSILLQHSNSNGSSNNNYNINMINNINDNENSGKFLFSAVPSGLRKARYYSLLPGRPQSRRLWRTSSHAAINARRLFEYNNSSNNADIRPGKALKPLTQLLEQAVFL